MLKLSPGTSASLLTPFEATGMPLGAQVWDYKDGKGPFLLPPTPPLLSRQPQQSLMLRVGVVSAGLFPPSPSPPAVPRLCGPLLTSPGLSLQTGESREGVGSSSFLWLRSRQESAVSS